MWSCPFTTPTGRTYYLVTALMALKPILFLTDQKPPALDKPPNFCRSLRKNLDYAQVLDVVQEPGQRVIQILLKTHDGPFKLIFEGLPKYPNLILIGGDGGIISALRYRNDSERPVLPQVPYSPAPQPGDKPNLWDLDPSSLQALWAHGGPSAPRTLAENRFAGHRP